MNADVAFRASKHALATLLALLTLGAAAPAQHWPTKTVGIVVPFGPGSTPDVVARLVADGLQQKYPASAFVVENKPGVSGNLGTDIVAKATPDGSTLGVSTGGPPRNQQHNVFELTFRFAVGYFINFISIGNGLQQLQLSMGTSALIARTGMCAAH